MSIARAVAVNTSYQVAGKLVSSSFSFLSTFLLARYLGVHRYGLFVTAGVYFAFFETFMDFGLSQVLVRRFALDPSSVAETLSRAMTLKLLIGVSIFAFASVVGLAAFHGPGREELRWGAFLLSLTFLVTWMVGTYATYFIYLVRHRVLAISTIVAKCAALAAVVLFMFLRMGLTAFFAVNVVSWILALGVLAVFARRERLRLHFAVDLKLWRELLREAAPLGMVIFLNTLYGKADTLLLAAFRSPGEVGAYGLAYTVVEFAMAPAGFLMTTLFPTLAAASADPGRVQALLARSMKVLLVMGFGVFMVAFACSAQVVNLLGGPGFQQGILPLQILSAAVLVSYFNAALGHTVIAIGRQDVLFRSTAIVLATNLAANVVAIPLFGLQGAAATMIFSEALSLLLLTRAARTLGIHPVFPSLSRLIAVSAAVLAVVWPWYHRLVFADSMRNALSLTAGALTIAAIYLALLSVLRILPVGGGAGPARPGNST